MILRSFRQGFACNSSSEHTIALLSDEQAARARDEVIIGAHHFGWENFVLATPESKTRYVAATLFDSLHELFPADVASLVVKDWTGVDVLEGLEVAEYGDKRVDHQSRIAIPLRTDGDHLNREFFTDLNKYLQSKNIVVYGGNDNDDEPEDLRTSSPPQDARVPSQLVDSWCKYWRARKDGDWWVVFNKSYGDRFTFSFEAKPAPLRLKAPLMVDLKITDKCMRECSFCYQGSTRNGQHGDQTKIIPLIQELGELGVFEVAIGGGEPTLHPQFVDFLEWCRREHIAASFTTRSLDWLREPGIANRIAKAASSFSFSVASAQDVMDLYDALVGRGFYNTRMAYDRGIPKYCRPNVQVVLELVYDGALKDIASACNLTRTPLILLGFKRTGRGGSYEVCGNPNWMEIVKSAGVRVGVDAVVVQQYGAALRESGIPHYLLAIDEGVTSCYVDAVGMRVGPSSYAPPERFVLLGNSFKDAFEAISPKVEVPAPAAPEPPAEPRREVRRVQLEP